MDKKAYAQANKEWLMQKSKEDRVKALPKGIYYKVLSEGRRVKSQAKTKFSRSGCAEPHPILSKDNDSID